MPLTELVRNMEHNAIFDIQTEGDFLIQALRIFKFQYDNNVVYHDFCTYLNVQPDAVHTLEQIPFLPIEFFKSKDVLSTTDTPEIIFTSSGTTGSETSKHYVTDLSLYEQSYLKAFKHFYGDIEDYCVVALLPSYLERTGSSLIYMAKNLIKKSNQPERIRTTSPIAATASKNRYQNFNYRCVFCIARVYRAISDVFTKHHYYGNWWYEREKKRNCTPRVT